MAHTAIVPGLNQLNTTALDASSINTGILIGTAVAYTLIGVSDESSALGGHNHGYTLII